MFSRILGIAIIFSAQLAYAAQATYTTSPFVVVDSAITNVRQQVPIAEISETTIKQNCEALANDVVTGTQQPSAITTVTTTAN